MAFLSREDPEKLSIEQRAELGRFPEVWTIGELAELIVLKEDISNREDRFRVQRRLEADCESGKLRYLHKEEFDNRSLISDGFLITDVRYKTRWEHFLEYYPEAKGWATPQQDTRGKTVDEQRADIANAAYRAGEIHDGLSQAEIFAYLRKRAANLFARSDKTLANWWSEFGPFPLSKGRKPGR